MIGALKRFFRWLRCHSAHAGYMGPGYAGMLGVSKRTTCDVCGEEYYN